MEGYFSRNRTTMFEMQSYINCSNFTKVNSGIQNFYGTPFNFSFQKVLVRNLEVETTASFKEYFSSKLKYVYFFSSNLFKTTLMLRLKCKIEIE